MARLVSQSSPGQWNGVETKAYKNEGTTFRDVVRRQILGPDTPGTGFELRYFEVAPGGYTSLEIHEHTHTVIIVRGRGTFLAGSLTGKVGPGDVVHSGPHDPHQFLATEGEAFGFYCLVHKERDRPRVPTPEELDALRADPRLRDVFRV